MSPRSEEQNEIIKDERREQILSAALRCFATRGYAATKISDIVARAGMSHGLVYHYFKSKEEIFYALLTRAMQTSSQSILSVEQIPIPSLEKIRQIARYILGGIESFEDSAYYFLIVTHASIMESPSAEHKDLMSSSGAALQSFSRMIKAGQEAGDIKDGDPFGMALVFFAAIQGLAMYKLAMTDFKMPDPEILVNMIKK
jgi:AcrR family transcriptional regulator